MGVFDIGSINWLDIDIFTEDTDQCVCVRA